MGDQIYSPVMQVFTSDGDPGVGYKLYTYDAGTTTPKVVYTDEACSVSATNPVVFDSRGEAVIYFTGEYKFVLKTDADVTVWTVDNVSSPGTPINHASIEDYSSNLTTAVAAIGATETSLYITEATAVSGAVVVPSTLELVFERGGVINHSTYALTINGPVVAGRYQIFNGTGTLSFGEGYIERAMVQWTGTVGDGATDNAVALNQLFTACRAYAIPVYFSSGDYITTVSLNMSGANYDQDYTGQGWVVSGAGAGSTTITGNLAAGYPIVDMSDNFKPLLKDLRIQGHASGSQLCGVLHGMVGSTLSIQGCLDNVVVSGTFAEAAYINMSADLAVIKETYLEGPCGMIITSDVDALGAGVIKSLYQTLTVTPNITLTSVRGGHIVGIGGDSNGWDSAIVFDECYKLQIDQSTYIAQDGTARAGITVAGESGVGIHDAHSVDFYGRYENQSDSPEDGCFLWVETANSVRNSIFKGYVGGHGSGTDAGQWFYLENSGIYLSEIAMAPASATDWAHVVQRDGSVHEIYGCQIYEQTDQSTLLDGTDAELFGDGNDFHLYNWHADWLDVSGTSTFFTQDKGRIDFNKTTGFNSVGLTDSLSRKFIGHYETNMLNDLNTAAAGDEELSVIALPGDIAYANTAQNVVKAVFTAWGSFTANGNAKTVKGKFGTDGAETTVVTNDITASPNGTEWRLTITMFRAGLTGTGTWYGFGEMLIANIPQTFNMINSITSDPDAVTTNFVLTVDAAANDVLIWGSALEMF